MRRKCPPLNYDPRAANILVRQAVNLFDRLLNWEDDSLSHNELVYPPGSKGRLICQIREWVDARLDDAKD